MSIYNQYFAVMASVLLLTTAVLTAVGASTLSLYYVIYVIEALVITELFAHFKSEVRRGLGAVGFLLFVGFMVVVTSQIILALQ